MPKHCPARNMHDALCEWSPSRLILGSNIANKTKVFDPSENSWDKHLNGARGLMEKLRVARTTSSQLEFLADWFAYHDVLHDYSRPHHKAIATVMGQNYRADDQIVGISMIRH